MFIKKKSSRIAKNRVGYFKSGFRALSSLLYHISSQIWDWRIWGQDSKHRVLNFVIINTLIEILENK